MNFELLQPWSTFIMKTKLPSHILYRMVHLTDNIVEDKKSDKDVLGAGQIQNQFLINLEILREENVANYFLDAFKTYVIQAFHQSHPDMDIPDDEWFTQIAGAWINSQYDNEYFPSHFHTSCEMSSVMYLKVPKFLPARKVYKNRLEEDGCIEFYNSTSTDKTWAIPNILIRPQVGDFLIFSSTQYHHVYPFRTEDGKGERRSVSINAQFTRKNIPIGQPLW